MKDPIQQALDRITRISGVEGAIIVTGDDGLIVADAVMENVRREAVAALAASLARRLSRACRAAGIGTPGFLHLQSREGTLLAMPATKGIVVVVIGDRKVNVGLVRLEMQQAVEIVG